MLKRIAFASMLVLSALPALAADAPQSPQLDQFEATVVDRWKTIQEAQRQLQDTLQKSVLDQVRAVLEQMFNERRALKAELADALKLCGDKCKPVKSEANAPAAAEPTPQP